MVSIPAGTLGIEFAMPVDGAIADVTRFGGAVDSATDQAVRQINQVEAAAKGMFPAGAAIAAAKDFGATIAQTSVASIRAINQVERSGEALIRQLERQTATYGKSASELMSMRAETQALAAEQVGLIDLANRIREAEAARWGVEYEAARRAQQAEEALAQERETASTQAAAAAAREAAAIRDAAIAHQQFEQRVRAGAAAMKEEEQEKAALAASSDRLIALMEREVATYGKSAAQIRAMDVELRAAALEEAGLTAQAQRLREAHANLTTTQQHGTVVTGQARAGMQQFAMNMGDVATSYAGGAKMGMIFAQQSGQVAQSISLMAGEASGFAKFLGGPWLIAGTAAVTLVMALAGASEQVKTKAEREAEALKTVQGAIDALDQATGRLHKTKQQEIADSAAATKQHLSEAMAKRQLLAAQLEAYKAPAAYGGTSGMGIQGTSGVLAQMTASSIAANEAEIRKLQASLGGVGFAAAVDKATAATDRSFAATRAYEQQLARIQAAWERSDKTARDQELVTKLVTAAMEKRDAATKSTTGSSMGLIDANSRITTATNAVQRAEGELARVRAQNAIDLASHKITSDQATERLNAARSALYQARDAAKEYGQGLREQKKDAREFAETLLQIAHGAEEARMGQLKYAESVIAVPAPSTSLHPQTAFLDSYVDKLDDYKKAVADGRAEMDKWADAADRVQLSAGRIADAWGNVGHAIGGAMDILAEYGKKQAEFDAQRKAGAIDQATYIKQSASLQLNSLIGLTDAAKGLFKEHSKGYEAMVAAEKALTIVQLARTAVDVAGGAARMFATLGPFAFPAVAAMIAVMASLGFHGGGGGGAAPVTNSGTGTVFGDESAQSDSIKRAIETLSDVDRLTMGYSAQMAASLKSIETNIGGLTNLIVRAGGANGLNASAGVQTGFNSSIPMAAFDALLGGPIGLAFGPLIEKIPVIGDIVSGVVGVVRSLFGTKTTVVGNGIYGGPQSLADILSGGFDGSTYSDIEKKKKFFGVTTGKSYSTQYGNLDSGIENQFALILKSFDDAITATAGPLGQSTDAIQQRLNSFVVNIGKIDLTGLTGQQIQEKLEAVFGAAADGMAQAAVPGLEKFQQVGEGYFETLTRVASTVEAVTSDLNMLGLSTSKLGLDAKMGLAGLFGSVSGMDQATQAYFQAFYSDAEQTAMKTAQLGQVFASLGLAMPSSIAGYRALVEAQDLTTAAGQQTYAALIQLAPAFAEITSAGKDAATAAAIVRERQDLQTQLLQLEGDTTAIRAAELSQLDASNRAIKEHIYALQDEQAATQAAAALEQQRASLQQQLWQLQGDTASIRAAQLAAITDPVQLAMQQQIFAMQDQQAAAQAAAEAEQKAAQAADQLRQAWQSVGDSIEDEIRRIRGLSDNASAQSFATLQGQFNAAVAAAQSTDQDLAKAAASSLPGLSKSLLDAAEKSATSQQELERIQGLTASALQSIADKIRAFTVGSSAVSSDFFASGSSAAVQQSTWWNTYAAMASTSAGSAANDDTATAIADLKSELTKTKAELVNALTQIAAANVKTADVLSRAERAGNGDGLAVTTATERAA